MKKQTDHPDDSIGFLFKQIVDKLKAHADADLKKHGLTFSQLRVLEYLHVNGGTASQKEITKYLDVAHPTAVGLIDRLAKNGFVVSMQDKTDRRSRNIIATDKQKKFGKQIIKEREHMERKLLAGLSDKEIRTLKKLLEKLNENLKTETRNGGA